MKTIRLLLVITTFLSIDALLAQNRFTTVTQAQQNGSNATTIAGAYLNNGGAPQDRELSVLAGILEK
jgi:hypothetical protein